MVESETWLPIAPLSQLLPKYSPADVDPMQWLTPTYVRDGQFSLGIYSFLVQTPNRALVVDTTAGNAKPRTGPMFNMLDTNFIELHRDISRYL